MAENEIEKIRLENEAVQQETTELSATNDLLREQTDGLIKNREKSMSDNKALEQRQKKLQQDIEKKMAVAGAGCTNERKGLSGKNAMPLVERLKDIVKSLTIKCVNLMEQIKQIKAKIAKQAEDIDFYKGKVHQQYVKLEQLQEKADDFERVKQYVGVDKIDIIVTNARELERIAQSRKQQNKAYGMSR